MKSRPSTISRSGAKWLPGALALVATAATSQGATVQITLTGNKVSSTSAGGNTLNADLTGDGANDVNFSQIAVQPFKAGFGIGGDFQAVAGISSLNFFVLAALVGGGLGVFSGDSLTGLRDTYLNSISFSDSRINRGAVTGAWLEVHAFNTSQTSHTVQLTRLIFDDASVTRPGFTSIPGVQTEWVAVPEPSSFALLGLGAAGVLARRRRQAA